jgi:hypothetical protein
MKLRWAPVAVAIVAIPMVSGCGTSRGSSACSMPNQRELQASMSSVERRADVTSLRAFGPLCEPYEPGTLSAQRLYRPAKGVADAIKSALSANGWAPTRAPDGDLYTGQIKDGRFVTHVELSMQTNEESGSVRSVLQALFVSRKP